MPGSHAHPALLGIQFEDLVVIFRGVDLNPFADRLSGLRRAAAAHGEGAAEAMADLDRADEILARFGNDDAQRADLVDAGVGGVKAREMASKRTSPSIWRSSSRRSASLSTSAASALGTGVPAASWIRFME